MKIKFRIFVALASIAFANAAAAQHFEVVALGTHGGEPDNNLSSYLVSPIGSREWIALDAGTYCSQLHKIKFDDPIQAYLITHAHLDHISGLVVCSPGDTQKEIFGINSTIDYLRDNIFNWKIWPNFADEGYKPLLKVYHYHRLSLNKTVSIPKTMMNVRAFPLSHGNGGYPSTAFLIEANGFYLLYFGDTGADPIEGSRDIKQIWKSVAPIIRENKLSAIFIEASYPNSRPEKLLFGHLTPNWLLYELRELALEVDPKKALSALNRLNIAVIHIKEGLGDYKVTNRTNVIGRIQQEINAENNLGVKFIFPKQGEKMTF